MRTSKKIISSVLAAGFVSGAFVGTASAIDFGGLYGDSNGSEPVFFSSNQQNINKNQLNSSVNRAKQPDARVLPPKPTRPMAI